MPKTFSFIDPVEEIEIGEVYYFGQLVDGEGDIEQLLEDGCVGIGDDVIEFTIEEHSNDIFRTLVKVTDIY